MIVGVLMVGAFMGAVKGLVGPMQMLTSSLDMLAGAVKREPTLEVHLDMSLTPAAQDRLLSDPEFKSAITRYKVLSWFVKME